MAVSVSKTQVLSIYKNLLRESQKFSNYNFRNYALRRIRDSFRENKLQSDSRTVKQLFNDAKQNLELIKRQTTIGHMFESEKLVIENRQ